MIKYRHNNGPALRVQEALDQTAVLSEDFKSFINNMIDWALKVERKETHDPFIKDFSPHTGDRK